VRTKTWTYQEVVHLFLRRQNPSSWTVHQGGLAGQAH